MSEPVNQPNGGPLKSAAMKVRQLSNPLGRLAYELALRGIMAEKELRDARVTCVTCGADIPPGRPGRKCKPCREQ